MRKFELGESVVRTGGSAKTIKDGSVYVVASFAEGNANYISLVGLGIDLFHVSNFKPLVEDSITPFKKYRNSQRCALLSAIAKDDPVEYMIVANGVWHRHQNFTSNGDMTGLQGDTFYRIVDKVKLEEKMKKIKALDDERKICKSRIGAIDKEINQLNRA